MFAKRALGLAVGGLCGWTVKVAYCKESNRWGYTPPCPINPDNSIVYFDINADDKLLGRVEFEVFDDVSPLLATNFKALSYGYVLGYPIVSKHPTRGKRHGDKRLMSYHNTLFHKVVPGFIAQGGDNELYNGRGGESYSGENLKDCFRGKCGTIMEGSLCMASHARNANRSQFFIAFAPIPHLSGKNSVVGQVISGWDVIKEIETYGSVSGYPTREISVGGCGILKHKSGSLYDPKDALTIPPQSTWDEKGAINMSNIAPKRLDMISDPLFNTDWVAPTSGYDMRSGDGTGVRRTTVAELSVDMSSNGC
eukprot:TRINITY_DN1564_c0_g1_i1.p1 TRINITY_DN1564_c0_g1~~TRINITY_DN1564_c0_g1_i1.p1  ORF type:complete len:318 (+),score=70.04 TRINITY_DN1564_c0_g1_i1:29-955(+)